VTVALKFICEQTVQCNVKLDDEVMQWLEVSNLNSLIYMKCDEINMRRSMKGLFILEASLLM
jgi:hypothetical protein